MPPPRQVGMTELEFSELLYKLESNNALDMTKMETVFQDMTLSLASYFIYSSHKTYLVSTPLKGDTSVDMYRKALL